MTSATSVTKSNFRWFSTSQKIQRVVVIKPNAHQLELFSNIFIDSNWLQSYSRDLCPGVIFENNSKRCNKYRRIEIEF